MDEANKEDPSYSRAGTREKKTRNEEDTRSTGSGSSSNSSSSSSASVDIETVFRAKGPQDILKRLKSMQLGEKSARS